jgi:predicted transcriptional regulator
MARQPSTPRPTDAELRILAVLWERGPSTVREVHQAMGDAHGVGSTTVLKLMQIMTDKGLIVRDRRQRPQVYTAARSEEETQQQMVGGLRERAFGGSTAKLIQRALSSKPVSDEELSEIRALLDEIEGGRR